MAQLPMLTDEQLCPANQFVNIKTNNQYVDFNSHIRGADDIVLEILKGHPLAGPLSLHEAVPRIYLQQAWRTTHIVVDQNGAEDLVFTIDRTECQITLESFREGLQFPLATDRANQDNFDPLPTLEQVVAGINQLGYLGGLRNPAAFRRGNLQGYWEQFFSFLQRCLTQQYSGFDKTNKEFLQLFHGFCFNLHIDYASIIWKDLVSTVKKKTTKTYIPYMRFFQIIIDGAMAQRLEISQRDRTDCVRPNLFIAQKSASIAPGIEIMTIPLPLLRYADQTSQVILAYIQEKYPNLAQQQGAQGAQPAQAVPEEQVVQPEALVAQQASQAP